MKSIAVLLKRRHFWLQVLVVVATLYLVCFGIHLIIVALYAGVNVSTYPTDGTFQLYNPMRRILLGQTPGLDFPFFHGLGIPLLHFPVFYLLGQNLFAAEVAKWLVAPGIFYLTSAVFMYAFFRNVRMALLGLGMVVLVGSLWLTSGINPGNSLLGVRAALPLLVAAALVWQTSKTIKITKTWSVPANILAAILLLAVAFLCSTEQGIAAGIAYVSIRSYYYLSTLKARQMHIVVARVMTETLVIVLATLLLLTVVTKGHPAEALRFALVDIPANQGWYFGVPPNPYLSLDDLTNGFSLSLIPIVVIITAGIFATIIMFRKKIHTHARLAFLYLIVYGLIVFCGSSMGYFTPVRHLVPLGIGMLLVASAFTIYQLYTYKSKRPFMKYFLLSVILLLTAFFVFHTSTTLHKIGEQNLGEIMAKVQQAHHKDDTFVLNDQWKQDASEIMPHIPQNARIWSTYTSVYDSTRGQLNGSSGGEDYIIHALGDKRRDTYARDFVNQKPEFVITMRPGFFNYEEWLWGSNWNFYKQLFMRYEVISMAKMHVLWKHRVDTVIKEKLFQPLEGDGDKWVLPDNKSATTKLYEVKVDYEASSGLGLSFFDRVPRYFMNISNTGVTFCPLSLPSANTSWTFPVFVGADRNSVSIAPAVGGIVPIATLDIKSISYRQIKVPEATALYFADNADLSERFIKRKHRAGCTLN